MPTPLPRPGPTDYQDAPGTELDLVWDELCDVVEATEATANAALPATQAAAGTLIAAAADKATPVDADSLALSDSAAGGILRRFSWASLKAALNGVFARLAGVSGGQTLIGGTASGENLTLQSTAHATRGKLLLGAGSAYDEAAVRLGIGTQAPAAKLHILNPGEQARLGYDASNYYAITVSSAGAVTHDATGQQHTFKGGSGVAPMGANLVSNGYFASNLSGWTDSGATWSWSAGAALHAAGAASTLSQAVALTAGVWYVIQFAISGRTAGTIDVSVGSNTIYNFGSTTTFSTNSTFSRAFTASASGSVSLTFTPSATFDGSVDAVVLQSFVPFSAAPAIVLFDQSSAETIRLSGTASASSNVGLGRLAHRNIALGAAYNCAFGHAAQANLASGSGNTAVGYNAHSNMVNGRDNTAVGYAAGQNTNFGSYNCAIGVLAANAITTGSNNNAMGYGAMYSAQTINDAIAIGQLAAYSLIVGDRTICVGTSAGRFLANGSTPLTGATNCTYVGASTKASADSIVNENVFGYNATGIGSNSCVLGSSAVTKCQIFGDIILDKTVTAGGTTGAQTINKTVGSVNFAAAATSLVVTNNRVTASSIIVATVATADATMKSVVAVAAAGSFTLTANAAATAETRVNFIVIN